MHKTRVYRWEHLTKLSRNMSVFDIIPILRDRKQANFFFQKTVKLYLVPATSLKN
jgi:hypothetical protein